MEENIVDVDLIAKYHIKTGTILYTDRKCGVKGHYIQFFEVTALKKQNQVVLREIDRKIVSHNEDNRALVIPSIGHFCLNSNFIEDNSNGVIKNIEQDGEGMYIVMKVLTNPNVKSPRVISARLWDGEPKAHYSDFFEYVNEKVI